MKVYVLRKIRLYGNYDVTIAVYLEQEKAAEEIERLRHTYGFFYDYEYIIEEVDLIK